MKNYSYLVNKQLKLNKKRSLIVVFTNVLIIILFILIAYINTFIAKINIQETKNFNGNYEGKFEKLNFNEVNYLKQNVKVRNSGFLVLEGSYKINVDGIQKDLFNYSLDMECINKIFNKSIDLEEGSLPNKDKEVILEINAKGGLNKKIGDNIKIGSINYKIVGFYKSKQSNNIEFKALSLLKDYKKYKSFYGFVNLKEKSNLGQNIFNIAKNIGIDEHYNNENAKVFLNETLLNQIKQDKVISFNINVTLFLLTGFLIYVCMNLSIKERIKHLSVLRCLGATSNKIRYLIIKENLILSSLVIIISLILGHLLIYSFVNVVLKNIIKMNFYGVRLHISLKIILQAIILVYIVSIIISTIAYKKIIKPSPIELLKNKGSNLKKSKIIKNNFINKIFGYKGELAYKSIRSNNSSFLIITVLEIISLIALVVITSFYTIIFKNIKEEKIGVTQDFSIIIYSNLYNQKLVKDDLEKSQNLINNLKKNKEIKDISTYMNMKVETLFTKVKINKNIENKFKAKSNEEQYLEIPQSTMLVYDDEAFKNLIPYIKGEKITLDKFNENGIVLINTNVKSNNLKDKEEPIIYVKSGDNLKIYFKSLEKNLNNNIQRKFGNIKFLEFNVLGSINSRYISDIPKFNNFNEVNFIISKKFYEKNKNLLVKDKRVLYLSTNINFNFINKNNANIIKNIKSYVDEIGGFYIDNYGNILNRTRNLLGSSILVYTVMFFLWAVAIISFINNRNLSISLRKEEFGIMRAIGMNKRDLKKVILLEGLIQWLIVSIIGGILSYIAIIFINIFFNYNEINSSRNISLWILGLGIIILLTLNLISVIVPLRKFKDFNIIEMING